MKTPMQELLEWVRATLPMDLDTPRMIEEKIESLLEKEKEVMCEFAIKYAMADRKEPCETSTQLVFDETFKINSK
jgi:hypothetical protein